jgi:DNA-directed RNA polymerase I, II, and III subunit RPABC2
MVGEETTTLVLKNVTDGTVAYKVKTTAQKKYLVSPSNGILTAGETVTVSILRQARYVPAEKEDRFMVLACPTTSTEKLSRDEWGAQSNVEDIRLKVVLRAQEVSPASAKNTMDDARKSDLQAKYDELLTYTLDLERKKKAADTQLENLTSSTSSKGKKSGYPLYVLLFVMISSAATSRNFEKLVDLFETQTGVKIM